MEQPAAHEPAWWLEQRDGQPVVASIVPAQPLPPAPTLPAGAGRIGLFEIPNSTRGFEAAAQTRYLFEQVWHVPYTDVTADDVVAGLAGIDVLVVPDGYANYGVQALGAKGKKALRDWVNAGGRVVAWQGGVEVAVKAGVSTAKLGGSKTDTSGALLRVSMAGASPLASGIGTRDWVMYQDDKTMQPGLGAYGRAPSRRAVRPTSRLPACRLGIDTLAGSAVVTDEAVGSGRIIAFSVDPNFRALDPGHAAGPLERARRSGAGQPDPRSARGIQGARRGRSGGTRRGERPARCRVGDPGPRPRCRCDGDRQDPEPPRRHRRAAGPRLGRLVPRREQEGPVVRGASVVRADRPRPGQGGDPGHRRERAVGVTRVVHTGTTGSVDQPGGPRLSSVDLQRAYFLCIGARVVEDR